MAKFFDVPFAEQGDKDPVPTGAQPNGSVSYTTGYTPDYEIDLDIDDPNAKPVERGSMNDLFHDITEALGFIQKHGAADWSTAGKPYTLNDIVRFGDKNWLSLVPVNNDQPAEGLSWTEFSAQVLKGKLERIAIVQVAGNNTDKIMSQKAVSDAVALKLDRAAVKQAAGGSSSDIMSQKAVTDAVNSHTPAGAVMPFAGVNQPDGWLIADGRSVSRTQYQKLFSVISTTYGDGDGFSSFNLPDLRGEFIRGFDRGRGVDSGRTIGSNQRGTLVGAYDDDASNASISFLKSKNQLGYSGDQFDPSEYGLTSSDYLNNGTFTSVTKDVANSFYNVTRPRNIALLYCIKT